MGSMTTTTPPIAVARIARALTYLAYAFVIVALLILLLGFFLQLFGANPDAPFAEWLYRGLKRVMAPFRGLFEPVALDGRSVLDVSILFAMIVYGNRCADPSRPHRMAHSAHSRDAPRQCRGTPPDRRGRRSRRPVCGRSCWRRCLRLSGSHARGSVTPHHAHA
jgi:uncharacterized protein YggT (Ycf19 family)